MKLELFIPTNLSEIKLAQYQKFLKIAETNEDSEFLHQKMVQYFCGVDLRDIANIKHRQVMEITASINEMFKVSHKLIPRFKMGGVEFGFIPNLENITQGEFVDLDTYISDWQEMHKAMAVLFRPITKKVNDKYQIEDYNGSITYSEVMKHAPLDVVLGATVFFYHLGNELMKSTLTYLEENPQVQSLMNKHNSENGGDGIALSMLSLKETLDDLMKYQNFPLDNV
jgi:hypothetical protein